MQEDQWKHVDSNIIRSLLLGNSHRIFNGVQHLNVSRIVMEHRDASWEAGNRTERAQDTLADLVLLLEQLEALPVHKVNK